MSSLIVGLNWGEYSLKALTKRTYTPAPAAWEDQVLYFLMLDCFSDDRELDYRGDNGRTVTGGSTPFFQPVDESNAIQTEADGARWREAGALSTVVGDRSGGLVSAVGQIIFHSKTPDLRKKVCKN